MLSLALHKTGSFVSFKSQYFHFQFFNPSGIYSNIFPWLFIQFLPGHTVCSCTQPTNIYWTSGAVRSWGWRNEDTGGPWNSKNKLSDGVWPTHLDEELDHSSNYLMPWVWPISEPCLWGRSQSPWGPVMLCYKDSDGITAEIHWTAEEPAQTWVLGGFLRARTERAVPRAELKTLGHWLDTGDKGVVIRVWRGSWRNQNWHHWPNFLGNYLTLECQFMEVKSPCLPEFGSIAGDWWVLVHPLIQNPSGR